MAIGPLWCSLMSVSLFHTLLMEVGDVGEIIEYASRRIIYSELHADLSS